MTEFAKTQPAGPGAFGAEAAGLRWLAVEGGAPVVRVLAVSESRLTLERLSGPAPERAAAALFGARLARTHDAGAVTFGASPAGWSGPLYIGLASLPAGTAPTWGAFYAAERVLPFARAARDQGALDAGQSRLIDAVAARLATGEFDDAAPPARIHGDLWAGNVIPGPDGLTLIDPAAHGGHRVTDLAMLALFGVTHLATIWDAYAAESTWLPDGWRDLVPLHQLHPLLVHAVLFGGAYGPQAARAAHRYA
ncbi:MAG: fructosamine kinase family protein [Propionibacteriaceae bacterium]|jgi:fructosamine-3-kinase|nr:fructosamine kinase family protein [Propionibacteriaceae bacterium]